MSQKDTSVQDQLKSYYGKRLKRSEDLQTDVACYKICTPLSKSAADAMRLIHPEVTQRYFGCGLVVPESLERCHVLDLGSGSGRDCYVLGKLVGPNGHVTGVDMTDELIQLSRNYISYHQEKFGYTETNTEFIQGYIEKLGEAGIQYNKFDVLISNCVICLCPDKKAVFAEAYRALKEGGEMYFSDMYASEPVDENLKKDSVLWGDVKYASGTYRFFKLPFGGTDERAWVTYKGTVTDHQEKLIFDSVHTFEKDKAVAVDGELALVLKISRFAPHFIVQPAEREVPIKDGPQQYCHLNPFQLANKLGSSIQQCSKTQKDGPCEDQTEVTWKCGEAKS
ncbi:arsenite methyltransferase isoform X2 [Stegostoma tigrinum]|uniref:arsenite methyltransferase isoform X2 n=1 Tax=Stegostoma tigrinum TaxID=3053191 RepID=UPI00202B5AC2|nr:arsenite methyltransferase isoform X2 [Stegostoma tigrinum]